MRSLSDFRDTELVSHIAREIKKLQLPRKIRIMEVCGGHTAAIYRYALRSLLPDCIELLSGPGCPVCVTPNNYVDHAIALAQISDTTIATFGDLIRVPGSDMTLSDARAQGLDIRVFYSSFDALEYARVNRERQVIFLAVGFETTACTIASSIQQARKNGIDNFKALSALKTMPSALKTLLTSPDMSVDCLILPGHVLTVTGSTPFEFISRDLGVPCAIAGFEPVDLLTSVHSLSLQIVEGKSEVINCYSRAVRVEGNVIANEAINKVFCQSSIEWRGLGKVTDSGLQIRPEFIEYDASQIDVKPLESREYPGCRCGEVLRGAIHPNECELFGSCCTPSSPVGACMVSSEGACAAMYNFEPDYAC